MACILTGTFLFSPMQAMEDLQNNEKNLPQNQKQMREVNINNLDDLERFVANEKIIFPELREKYIKHLEKRKATDTNLLEKHLSGNPKYLDIDDVMALLTFQNTYINDFKQLKENILKAKPEEYITALKYWSRVEKVESEEGYLPNIINANSNLGFIWGGLERRFASGPERSIRYLEKAAKLAEECTDKEWVTRKEYWYQQDPANRELSHRKDKKSPQRISFSKETAFASIYQELGKLQTAAYKSLLDVDAAREMFKKGIDAYVRGVLNIGDKACAEYLLPYRRDYHRKQVLACIEEGLKQKERIGYNLLVKVHQMFKKENN